VERQEPWRDHEPPRPGDPSASGPRPPARWRDAGWAALAVGLVGVTAWQLVRLLYLAATRPDVVPTSGGLVLAFLITVVWLLTVYWLAMGAWRRAIWGCPFEHDATAPAARRCARHDLVGSRPDDTGTTAAGPPRS
jgi:hypothetical protein